MQFHDDSQRDDTMSNMPPRMLAAPFRLTAMTLRGLGPYFHGARLEFKPLTVVCGENGSGKSTWIETLRALKSTVTDSRFPLCQLRYSRNHVERYGINKSFEALRAGLQTAGEIQSKFLQVARSGDREAFGPLGCIGLNLESTKGFRLVGYKASVNSAATDEANLLLNGEIPSQSKFTVRWAMPLATDGFEQLIELKVNSATIRLRRSLDRTPESTILPLRPQFKEENLTFECTGSFLGLESPDSEKLYELGYVKLLEPDSNETAWSLVDVSPTLRAVHPEFDQKIIAGALACFLKLFRQFIKGALRGFFPIGPIRKLLAKDSADSTPPEPGKDIDGFEDMEADSLKNARELQKAAAAIIRPERRYVGHRGERTQDLHAYWAYNLMRQPTAPFCGAISNEFNLNDFRRGNKSNSAADVFQRELSPAFQEHILSLVDSNLCEEWLRNRNGTIGDELAIEILNVAVRSRNLFAPRIFRPDLSSDAQLEVRLMIGETSEVQDERFASRTNLSDDEVVRANRLLLEAIFDEKADEAVEQTLKDGNREKDYPTRNCWHCTGYLLESFVSYWMNWFSDTRIKYGKFEGEPLDESWPPSADGTGQPVPNGGLVHKKWRWLKRGYLADRTSGRIPFMDGTSHDLACTVNHPVLYQESDWSMMSTGFHQLAPIVVQSGLIRQYEIMTVENPEAHLHPSLQLRVAEFLMHQANAGKIMLIETHSDLFVRRILRAIREEDVGHVSKGQAAVNICFTQLGGESGDGIMPNNERIHYATISEFTVNDRGQIKWPDGFPPEGFMTDNLDEARRFVDAGMDDTSEDHDERPL